MNTLKNKLFGAVLIMFVMMSFAYPQIQDPVPVQSKLKGAWVHIGQIEQDGTTYDVWKCVASTKKECKVGSVIAEPVGL